MLCDCDVCNNKYTEINNINNLSHKIYNKLNIQYFNSDYILNIYNNYNIDNNIINNNNNIEISFIMAHYNRPDLLLFTLSRLDKSSVNNFEVVIIDDRSNYKIDFLNNFKFKFPIKIIELVDDNKAHICPSNSYNLAFENSIGNIIVIQNPECVHLGDIPHYLTYNFKYDQYISFPCYSSNNINVNDFIIENIDNLHINNIELLTKDINFDNNINNFPIWYQHPIISNRNLHFCCAIDRNYFEILGGFSKLYNDGVCFEDDDFIFKIKNILKLDVIALDLSNNIGVIHMFHGRNEFVNIGCNEKTAKKRGIYEKYNLNEHIFNINKINNYNLDIPKLIHYYWDDFNKFSYMNFYSIKTAIYYNPEFIHIIWCPISPEKNITWNEFCNKDFILDDNSNNYISILKSLHNVRIIYRDIAEFLNVDNTMSEIHKSDLFRYKILYLYGGIWSDLDIVYIKSFKTVLNFKFDTINFLCDNGEYSYMPIGLMFSVRNSKLFEYIYIKAIENYDKNRYQCFGCELFRKLFLNNSDFKKDNIDILQKMSIDLGDKSVNLLKNENWYVKYNWSKIDELFINFDFNSDNFDDVVGFHWYNGSNITKKYLNNIINGNVPNNYNGLCFYERHKFIRQFNIIKIIEFKYPKWAGFYYNKLLYYYKFLSINFKVEIIKLESEYPVDTNFDLFKNIFDTNYTSLFIFDELLYHYFMINYVQKPEYRNVITNFLNNSFYICFFCELFEKDSLKTIGSVIYDDKLAYLFFKNCYKLFICNTKNRNILLKYNIFNNVIYFPPYGYSNLIEYNVNNTEKKYDILFYGNIPDDIKLTHRLNIINHLKNNNSNILIHNDIYGDDKIDTLLKTKIVIHIPSHKNLHTFPWAKVCELMSNKIFFIIEECDELYCLNLDKFIIFYTNLNDLKNKIDYYLNNYDLTYEITEKCYNYFINKYNMDFIKNLLINDYNINLVNYTILNTLCKNEIFDKHDFYSLHLQDLFIYRNLINNICDDGIFVEVGAGDGISQSNTFFFEQTLKFGGILIEPHIDQFNSLKKNRTKTKNYNVIVSDNLLEDFCSINECPLMSGIFKNINFSLLPDNFKNYEMRRTSAIKLQDLIKISNITYIDFLSIDTIGSELEVLKSIDFNTPIYLICIELNDYFNPEKDIQCRNLLLEKGFTLEVKLAMNELWINKNYPNAKRLFTKKKKCIYTTPVNGINGDGTHHYISSNEFCNSLYSIIVEYENTH